VGKGDQGRRPVSDQLINPFDEKGQPSGCSFFIHTSPAPNAQDDFQ
jgi:hypothetical protein